MASGETKEGVFEPLEVRVPGGGAPLTFGSGEEIRVWAQQRLRELQWIQSVPQRTNPVNEETGQAQQLLQNAENAGSQLNGSLSGDQERQTRQNAQSWISQLLQRRLWTVLTPVRKKGLDWVRERDPQLAVHVLHAWIAEPRDSSNTSVIGITGALVAAFFDNLLPDRGAREAAVLSDTIDRWGEFERQARSAFVALRVDFDEFKRENKEERWRHEREFQAIVSRAGETFEDVVHTYREKLALQAPVSYWTNKGKAHLWRSRLYGSLFIVLLLGFVAAFGIEIYEFWNLGAENGGFRGEALAAWQTVILVATATVFFWPLRILARLLLANIHLRSDAEERATMANTYLSLLGEGREMPETDRRLILEALFRPTVTGIVRDEALPPSVLSALSKISGGRL